jgi:hypothetical protein
MVNSEQTCPAARNIMQQVAGARGKPMDTSLDAGLLSQRDALLKKKMMMAPLQPVKTFERRSP